MNGYASGEKRKTLIARLHTEEPSLAASWINHRRHINGTSQLVKSSGCFPLTGDGNLNTYRLFAELFALAISKSGFSGVIVQSGLATDDTGKHLFDHLFSTGRLRRFLDFENTDGWFPNVHTQFRFALMTVGSPRSQKDAATTFGWMLRRLDESERDRWMELVAKDLVLFNPVSRTCPVFSTEADYEISKRIYGNAVHVFASEVDRFASVSFLGELYNMTRDSDSFVGWSDDKELAPLYESKLIHQFDHRFASYSSESIADTSLSTKESPDATVTPRYWVSKTDLMQRCNKRGMQSRWMCGFRDISNPENIRTSIVALFPQSAVGNNINLMLNHRPRM